MPEPDDNPYASPRSGRSSAQRVVRRMSLWAAGPLIVIAATAAFCGTCLPIGFVGFSVGYKGELQPFSAQGEVIMWIAWVAGFASAAAAGAAVWFYARRPVESAQEQA